MNIRPITIEFTGTPNSGKTTLIHALAKNLFHKGYTVKVMQEDAEIVPKEIPKKTWERNLWITFGQLQSLIEIPFYDVDIILLDRGYYDALFWTRFLQVQNVCSQEQSDFLYSTLTKINENFNLAPDWLFVIDVSLEESLKRRLSLGGNPSMANYEFVSSYKKELYKFYEKVNSPSSWYLDTTNCDELFVQMKTLYTINKILEE